MAWLCPVAWQHNLTYRFVQVGGMALNISLPLFFELIMETIYGWANEGAGVCSICITITTACCARDAHYLVLMFLSRQC